MTTGVFPNPPWPSVPGVDYGHDLSCYLRPVSLLMPDGSTYSATIFDLAADMSEVDGRQGLGESLARRLVTFATGLIDDANYGRDLTQYLNDDLSRRDLAKIASEAEAECLKDERVIHAKASAALLSGVLVIAIQVFDHRGPFKLTLTADQNNVSVLISGVT